MKRFLILNCFYFFWVALAAQNVSSKDNLIQINWKNNLSFNGSWRYSFENAFYKPNDPLPYFSTSLPVASLNNSYEVVLENTVFARVENEISGLDLPNEISPVLLPSIYKKNNAIYVEFVPLKKNSSGQVEKLTSFSLKLISKGQSGKFLSSANRSYTNASVLASGDWYKISVTEDGVYKLTYSFLKDNLKMDLSSSSPASFRLYGNGGGILPLKNSDFRYDDIQENAIYVYDGGTTGKWDNQDYVLFYGQSPVQWSYNGAQNRFVHQANYYSDSTFYFVTNNGGVGTPKRITAVNSLSVTPDFDVTEFDDYLCHEVDKVNFVKSGREFYGESFDINLTQTFSFDFPNILQQDVLYKTVYAAHSPGVGSSVVARYQNQNLFSGSFSTGTNYTDDFAMERSGTATFLPVAGDNVAISYTFSPGNSECVGYLNYIELQAKRSLTFKGRNNIDQMSFRNIAAAGSGKYARFTISSAPASMVIWNITDKINIVQQLHSNGIFTANADSLQQYIAFGGNNYLNAGAVGKIANQNLHGLSQADYIIVVHPLFEDQANRIADLHRTLDNMSVHVVTTDLIYNEFSSGAQDICGIRDFIKMFYDRGINNGTEPKYVLLFGDGSYDNKYRRPNNTNFIPTFQSENSYSFLNSFVADDFFGLMDDNEGLCASNEKLDIGIGRFIVQNQSEAKTVTDKTIQYASLPQSSGCPGCDGSGGTLGDWRNVVTFIADDEDGSLHVPPAESFAGFLNTSHKIYNVDKIYLDAYKQISTPAGQRYPDVNDAINKRVNKGSLVVNYIGHGGETGWAEERVLTNDDINSWTNLNKLPVFITATCEFSRWDDPARTSSGEKILLSATGGGVALFSTTRLVLANSNEVLNRALIKHMFDDQDPRLGDIMVASKIEPGNLNLNTRNFSLLGDPALKLHYPKFSIEATQINSQPLIAANDTLSALEKVTISGRIMRNGQWYSDFNGFIYPTVYDKASSITMLRNDPTSPNITFKLQKNILYKGKSTVKNGEWSFTFIVPKDISYQFGFGKLSFYAENGVEDGAGYFDSLMIGGSSGQTISDADGPAIKLYLNDERFVFGGTTNEKPAIVCVLSDSTGINTVGSGVGHDITAVLDGKTEPVYVLNDYYEADLDSYTSGKINYPLSKLSEGRHTLKVKAWDILNNSSEAYTEFVVASNASLALKHVLNYPNPFTTHTQFSFEYNKPCENLDVQIQIFTISGKLVKTISQKIITPGTRIDDLTWDGRDDYGDRIGRGVYIYRVKLNTPTESASETEKLVILK
jgi:hypothetical protein